MNRVNTRHDVDGKSIRLPDADILAQFTSEKAIKFWNDVVEKFPGEYDQLPEPGKWGRNKAIAIENAFRKTGAKIKRPLLKRLYDHALEHDEDADSDTPPSMRIDQLVIPIPKSNLKKWIENGYVTVNDNDSEGQIFMTFTSKGVEAAEEVEK